MILRHSGRAMQHPSSFSLLFYEYHLPLLILVASRPESHLAHSFTTGPFPEFHTTLALDDTYKPDEDIRLFLTENFSQVQNTHRISSYLKTSITPGLPLT